MEKTTRTLLEEIKEAGINFKITEKALQLKIVRGYEEVDWIQLGVLANADVDKAAQDLDKSYLLYK